MFFITKFVNKDGKIINLKEAAAAAPEEEKSTSNAGETSDTSTESNETDANTETNQEDTSTENQEDSNTENNDQQNPESEDMSSDDGMDFGDDTSEDGSTDDTSSSDTNSSSADPGNEEEEVDENKKAEEEIFSNLTHDQLDIKHKELKNQYLQLYDMTSEIIDRISSINISEDITFVVDYVSTTLSNLRDMVVDYINDVYKTKSYTENLINYNRFLATLSGINKILEEIDKTEEDKT